ncbi:MAG TPA: acetoacetate--CoA ligase, partial [Ignavibacteria bacterium]|nr:acetoacetate--CoA ligase [Ignavibacteria bacterium]
MNPPIWSPSRERIDNSNMAHFMSYIEKLTGRKMSTYNDLYDWSVTDIEKFWKSIWDISGIINSKGYDKILTGNKMFGAKWFVGAKLNFAENLLKYNDSNTAIISSREDAPQVKLTYSELYEFVSNVAESLKILGVREGDRVAGFITNIPETIISMLATTSIGAIWSSCSPDFGLKGVLDRFGQIQPKILFAVEEYQYNGKKIDCREKIKRIKANIPGIEKVILIPKFFNFGGKKVPVNPINKSANYLYFSQLLNVTSGKIKFEQLPFNHPIYIMYSSGTTGAPKCIVHSAGGTLLQHFKELSLHTNLKRHDIITYYTTCGWMMWNWLVSSLS